MFSVSFPNPIITDLIVINQNTEFGNNINNNICQVYSFCSRKFAIANIQRVSKESDSDSYCICTFNYHSSLCPDLHPLRLRWPCVRARLFVVKIAFFTNFCWNCCSNNYLFLVQIIIVFYLQNLLNNSINFLKVAIEHSQPIEE